VQVSCPNRDIEDNSKPCQGELEVEISEVDNGDGVWAQSGLAFWLPPDENGKVYCSEGCELTDEQIKKLEDQACDDYAKREP
jgi:hypothetical protein